MKKVCIMRGLSGSGKSSFAEKIQGAEEERGRATRIVSADKFFLKELEGELVYDFDPSKLPQAHQWCFCMYLYSLKDRDVDTVIVDNTNAGRWEIESYVTAATLFSDATIEIHEIVAETVEEIKTCVERSAHGTPESVTAVKALNMEPIPENWKVHIYKYSLKGLEKS